MSATNEGGSCTMCKVEQGLNPFAQEELYCPSKVVNLLQNWKLKWRLYVRTSCQFGSQAAALSDEALLLIISNKDFFGGPPCFSFACEPYFLALSEFNCGGPLCSRRNLRLYGPRTDRDPCYFKATENLLHRHLILRNNDNISVSLPVLKVALRSFKPTAEGHIMGHVKLSFLLAPRVWFSIKNLILLFGDARFLRRPHFAIAMAKRSSCDPLARVCASFWYGCDNFSRLHLKFKPVVRHDNQYEQFKPARRLAWGKFLNTPNFKDSALWSNLVPPTLISQSQSYEYQNGNEYFAVNFEYFILDPTFACRPPPTLARIFLKFLNTNP